MMFSRRLLVWLRGFVAFPLLVQAVDAQTIRGSLIDSLTSQPIDNAFVVLRDSNSFEVTRSITNARGAFSLAAPGPGAYVLRTERIGFGSTEAELGFLDSTKTLEVSVRVNPIVIRPDLFFYYAPDAATFFSDAFLSQHCFNLQRGDEHPGLIGLRFEPIWGAYDP
jgi:hypothetical protein